MQAADTHAARWFDHVAAAYEQSTGAAASSYPSEVAVFYAARWCQKTSGAPTPQAGDFEPGAIEGALREIVQNLETDGRLVDSLVTGDAEAWTALRSQLLTSARSRVGAAAGDFADEALQKIAEVLLTGTPPAGAPEQLRLGPGGPSNEYVFHAPFLQWARTVVINVIRDDRRRAARTAQPLQGPATAGHLDREVLFRASQALPRLLEAIRELPPVQRSVMVLSLARDDLDEVVRERLRELAPDFLVEAGGDPVGSDRDIGERLGTSARLVAANRSAARRKLARRDPLWALLLDALLPHRTTRPLPVKSNA